MEKQSTFQNKGQRVKPETCSTVSCNSFHYSCECRRGYRGNGTVCYGNIIQVSCGRFMFKILIRRTFFYVVSKNNNQQQKQQPTATATIKNSN